MSITARQDQVIQPIGQTHSTLARDRRQAHLSQSPTLTGDSDGAGQVAHMHAEMPTQMPASLNRGDAQFDTIEDTIQAFKNGSFIVVLDSPSRENEGDLIIAASALTPSKCAFMIRHTSGYMCVPMPAARAARLHLPPMVTYNADPNRTAYTISVDADDPAVTTGISAADRALTCRLLGSDAVEASMLRRPGHVLPLIARPGGVRERRGHTEATVDFCRLAGVVEVGVICELVEDGDEVQGVAERSSAGMMRRDGCLKFARRWGLRCCTIEALVEYLERDVDGVNGVVRPER